MRIGTGEHTYDWIDDWARIPTSDGSPANGRTHGVVVDSWEARLSGERRALQCKQNPFEVRDV
jgi:hypothetical protein